MIHPSPRPLRFLKVLLAAAALTIPCASFGQSAPNSRATVDGASLGLIAVLAASLAGFGTRTAAAQDKGPHLTDLRDAVKAANKRGAAAEVTTTAPPAS